MYLESHSLISLLIFIYPGYFNILCLCNRNDLTIL
jgi:hypothetical protein